MNIENLPFGIVDWRDVPVTSHAGTAGVAHWRARQFGSVRVRMLEYSFDRRQTRRATGERIEHGVLLLGDQPGWGVSPPQ